MRISDWSSDVCSSDLHQVLPLDHAHFGRLPRQTVLAAEAFHAGSEQLSAALKGVARVAVPFAPDSNLVCLAVNPGGNADLATANAFVRRLHDELRADPRQPLQLKQFFGSMTTMRPDDRKSTRLNSSH